MNAEETVESMIKAFKASVDDEDCIKDDYLAVYYGNILNIQPSGKYYMPWTTNQTEEDVNNNVS